MASRNAALREANMDGSNRRQPNGSHKGKTPTATGRLKVAAWTLVRALDAYLLEFLSLHGTASASNWIDQDHSPLGRRAHLKAVREGLLPGTRRGKKVFVSSAALRDYLEHGGAPRRRASSSPANERSLSAREVAARALEELGLEHEARS